MTEAKVRANVLLHEVREASLTEVAAALRGLGLVGNAAEAFCALARTAEASAADLVVTTGIPDSKIYYALQALVEKGLVEVQAGKPRIYRVVTPREVRERLSRMLEAKHERERAAVTRVASILEPLRAATRSPSVDIAYIVKGMQNVLARARSMVAGARREVVLLASDGGFVGQLEEELAQAAGRRVALRLAVPEGALGDDVTRQADVKSIVCSCLIIVVDGVQVMTVSRGSDASTHGITSTDETLVRLALEYWESPRCCVEP